MGYYTTFTGEITVTPPIPWSEIDGGPFDGHPRLTGDRDVKFRAVEEERTEGEWRMVRRVAVAVVPTASGEAKSYHIIEHLQELIDLYGEGRTFSGRFDAEGEEPGDLWRLMVRNGRAVRVDPVITWPDEEGRP